MGEVAERKRIGFSGFVLPLAVCRSFFPVALPLSASVCQPVITNSSQRQCVVLFLFSLLVPLMLLLKRSMGATDKPGPVNLLPVTVGYFAIGCSACNSLRPSTQLADQKQILAEMQACEYEMIYYFKIVAVLLIMCLLCSIPY